MREADGASPSAFHTISTRRRWRHVRVDVAVCPARSAILPRRPGPEVVIADARQLFDESYDAPDFLVGNINRAETRHAGHVDSVLDDPEQLLRCALVGDFFKVGRVRMQPLGKFGPLDARTAVTIDASPRRKGLRPRLHDRRVVERRRWTIGSVAVNRSGTDVDQRPGNEVRFGRGAGDAVKSAKKIDPRCYRTENREHTDECKKLERSHQLPSR